ncbi:hypothetical protein G4B88_008294 [Cannabis sativa]|nr:hypothetical protein G4B88_008294 [Cannabis sativa]
MPERHDHIKRVSTDVNNSRLGKFVNRIRKRCVRNVCGDQTRTWHSIEIMDIFGIIGIKLELESGHEVVRDCVIFVAIENGKQKGFEPSCA